MKKNKLLKKLKSEGKKARSCWDKAVYEDAIQIIQEFENSEIPEDDKELESTLLNGAENWRQYSEGGCALVCDEDIARHYCTPSELKKNKNGEKNPNSCETWLDIQSRGLRQSFRKISLAIYHIKKGIWKNAAKNFKI